MWVYVIHKILQQSSFHKCVLECTKFGRNIAGEVCSNNETWFCAYLCRTEDTMDYVCCNILCITYSILWPFSANISKSTKVIIFCFQEIFPSTAHSKKFYLPATSFSTPIVLFLCTHSGTQSYIYIYIYFNIKFNANILFTKPHINIPPHIMDLKLHSYQNKTKGLHIDALHYIVHYKSIMCGPAWIVSLVHSVAQYTIMYNTVGQWYYVLSIVS